jgi:hypothetical protein
MFAVMVRVLLHEIRLSAERSTIATVSPHVTIVCNGTHRLQRVQMRYRKLLKNPGPNNVSRQLLRFDDA